MNSEFVALIKFFISLLFYLPVLCCLLAISIVFKTIVFYKAYLLRKKAAQALPLYMLMLVLTANIFHDLAWLVPLMMLFSKFSPSLVDLFFVKLAWIFEPMKFIPILVFAHKVNFPRSALPIIIRVSIGIATISTLCLLYKYIFAYNSFLPHRQIALCNMMFFAIPTLIYLFYLHQKQKDALIFRTQISYFLSAFIPYCALELMQAFAINIPRLNTIFGDTPIFPVCSSLLISIFLLRASYWIVQLRFLNSTDKVLMGVKCAEHVDPRIPAVYEKLNQRIEEIIKR